MTGCLAAERGLAFTTAKAGEYVSGTLVGSTQLASGRFEMIDDSTGAMAAASRQAHRPAHHGHHARCQQHKMGLRQETRIGV